MDANKIINSLVAAAMAALVAAIWSLNANISTLGREIAVMQEHNNSIEREWGRREKMVDNIVVVQKQHGDRINKLEWVNNND